MAVAIPVPSVSADTHSQVRAATWASISAGIALVLTVPLVVMLAKPMSELIFVRGSQYAGDWGRAFTITLLILAPCTYTLFFGTAGELLKTRVAPHVHRMTMRVCAIGMVPYIALMIAGRIWSTGPQQSLMLAAGLTIPVGMVATIWASTQQH